MLHYYRYALLADLKINIHASYKGYSVLEVLLVTASWTQKGPCQSGSTSVPWAGKKRVLILSSVLSWPPAGTTKCFPLHFHLALCARWAMGPQAHTGTETRKLGWKFNLENKYKLTYIYILNALLLSSLLSTVSWSFSIHTLSLSK